MYYYSFLEATKVSNIINGGLARTFALEVTKEQLLTSKGKKELEKKVAAINEKRPGVVVWIYCEEDIDKFDLLDLRKEE